MRENISRRDFLKKTLVGFVTAVSLGPLASDNYKQRNQPNPELQYMQRYSKYLMKITDINLIVEQSRDVTIKTINKLPKKDLRNIIVVLEHIYNTGRRPEYTNCMLLI